MAQIGIAGTWKDYKGNIHPWIETGGAQSQAYSTTTKKTTTTPKGGGSSSDTGGTQPQIVYVPKETNTQAVDLNAMVAQILGAAPKPQTWTPPAPPKEPVVTPAMIAEWQERAKKEAGLKYDPQILAIQQTLEDMLAQAERSKATLEPTYQESIQNLTDYLNEQLGQAQQQWYARGLGRGTGLVQEENKLREKIANEIQKAEQQKNTVLAQIEEQKGMYTKQAGQQKTQLEQLKSDYIAARAQELEDAYIQQRTALEQQRFENDMAIAQFGMTKEAQDFRNWLDATTLALQAGYQQQLLGLQKEAQAFDQWAQQTQLGLQQKQLNLQAKSIGSENAIKPFATKTEGGKQYYYTGNQWVPIEEQRTLSDILNDPYFLTLVKLLNGEQ